MEGTQVQSADEVSWLTLRAANGLQIPYIGYVTVNCLGNHPGLAAFKTTVTSAEGKAWGKAFTICQRVECSGPRPRVEGVAKLSRQPPVIIPPHTEMVLWLQWRIGRTLAILKKGKVPCRLCNPNPYPVEVPQRQPLAKVTEVDSTDVQEEQQLVLNSVGPDVIEVAVRRITGDRDSDDDSHPAMSLQGDGLMGEQQQKMSSLLRKWKHVFSRHDEDFGRTGIVKHQIPTGIAPPSQVGGGQTQSLQVTAEEEASWETRQSADPDLLRIKRAKDQRQDRLEEEAPEVGSGSPEHHPQQPLSNCWLPRVTVTGTIQPFEPPRDIQHPTQPDASRHLTHLRGFGQRARTGGCLFDNALLC
uniref:Uncharacterized protein n=1 Tax=Knipowitschia caucasica TaxID=637954 RepID=A0AAV2JK74_KNICA